MFAKVEAKEIAAYVDAVTEAPLVAEIPEAAAIVREAVIEEVGLTVWQLANGVRVLLKPTDFKNDEVVFQAWSPGGTSLASDADYVPAMTATEAVGAGGVGAFSVVELQKRLADKAVRASPYISSLWEGISGQASPQDLETAFQLIYLHFTAPRRDSTAFLAYQTRMRAFLENFKASPEAAFFDTLSVILAQHHPRARPMTSETFEAMDLDKSLTFYRDRFADASDFTFVFVGAFDLETIRPLVQAYLGGLPSLEREETWRDEGIDPPTGIVKRAVYRGVEPKSLTQIVFTGAFEDTRDNRHALRSLAETMQIRLRERLREDLGGTYSVRVSSGRSRFPDQEYTVRVNFGSAPDRVEELVAVVFQQIDSLKSVGPTQADIEKVAEMQRRSRETNLEENGYWLFQIAAFEQIGLDVREILTYERLIDALTPSTVQEAARQWLRTDNYVRVSLYPESMKP